MVEIADIRRNTMRALIPPQKIALSAWIEKNIRLPESVSALPGPIRLYPYQNEIADAISDHSIERVTMIKAARLGFTTLLSGAIGNFVANDPSSILCVLPTESDCRDFVVSDIEPIFHASPVLRGTLTADNEDGVERNTLTSRRFPAGSLKIVAARSPRNLRRHTARVLLVDEADACETTTEGNPLRLAERRTMSFANRKIVIGSTPLIAETSNVLRSFEASDQRIYEVPCPECGAYQEIQWRHIEWPEGSGGEGAAYRCPHCSALVDERHKGAMVGAGKWRATRPEISGHAGFRCSSLVSLLHNASWSKLAAEFLAAKEDPNELMVFSNTVLAEAWTSQGAEIDDTSLASRAENFDLNNIPIEVMAITVGVDVQDDRVEAVVVGWTRNGEAFVLAHFVIWGSFTDDSLWLELDELLKSRWRHPHGGELRVDACVIDASDGDHTDRVLNFAIPRMRNRIFAGKGVSGTRVAFAMSKSKRIAGKLTIIGVDGIKATLFDRMQRGGPMLRFSNSLGPAFYEQLTAERRVIRYVRGKAHRRFEKIPGRRNEALDGLVYAIAARSAVNVVFDDREDRLRQSDIFGSVRDNSPPPSVVRSKWMQR